MGSQWASKPLPSLAHCLEPGLQGLPRPLEMDTHLLNPITLVSSLPGPKRAWGTFNRKRWVDLVLRWVQLF